jgi:glycosyltransferase involved in cell wall biosynthesis
MPPFEHILFIGPHYKNHRGGVGAVIEVYSKNITPFNFIPTMCYKNKFYELFFFAGAVLRLFFILLTNRKIKIVHIHGSKEGSVIRKVVMCFIARKIFLKKIVYHVHAGAYMDCYTQGKSFYKAMVRFLIHNSEAVVILSGIWIDTFNDNFKIKRSLVIRNPVEKRIESVIPRTNNRFTNFLFLGRIADHKGIFDLLQAIIEDQPNLRGKCKLYVGGNHDVEKLQQIIADNKIADLVEYVGWIQENDKDEHYRACDYFILPTYHEAMPMTILESFSYGKPVISTPVGSIPEILQHNHNGFLFTPGDIAALKKLINEVIDNPSLSAEFSTNALNKAAGFYPEAITNELKKLYEEILSYDKRVEVVL